MKKNKYFSFVFFILLLSLACSQKITVEFETFGGTSISRIEVKDTNEFKLPVTPEKEGYEFKGWYLDEEFKERFNSLENLTGSVKLYAKWEEIERKISEEEIYKYYEESYDYKNSFSYIYIEFDSKDEAIETLDEYGVIIDDIHDAWVHKDDPYDTLSTFDVVNIFIKMNNEKNNDKLIEGNHYKIVENIDLYNLLNEKISQIYIILDYESTYSDSKVGDIINILDECLGVLEDIDKSYIDTIYNSIKIINAIENIKISLNELNSSCDENTYNNNKLVVSKLFDNLVSLTHCLDCNTIVFNYDNCRVYSYKEVEDKSFRLVSKIQNVLLTYQPYYSENTSISKNEIKPTWYSYKPVTLKHDFNKIEYDNDKCFLVLPILTIKGPSIELVKDEIIEILKAQNNNNNN